jgi:hypothetical protein
MTETPAARARAAMERTYTASLICPVCDQTGAHEVLRARQVLALALADKPFHQVYGWTEGPGRAEDSPLYYGLCRCASCGFPGLENDFRLKAGESIANRRSLRRLFVEDRAGTSGALAQIAGGLGAMPHGSERSIRLLLGAIRAETLPYPEFWRRREIGRLHLRLALLYFDELHVDWNGPKQVPRYLERGPRAERLLAILNGLAPLRAEWPEIPLDPADPAEQALRFHREVYESRAEDPDPVQSVLEERRLAELYGMTGRREQAKEMLARARTTCARLRNEAAERERHSREDARISLEEIRALPVRIQRLNRLAEELKEEYRAICPPERKPAGAAVTAAGTRQDAKPAGGKRGFKLFG